MQEQLRYFDGEPLKEFSWKAFIDTEEFSKAG